jgi:glycerate kinase
MKILICPDKFKECLTSGRVALHIRDGIRRVIPDAECKILPLADGGEGTMEALTESTRGRIEKVRVHDPLMRPIGSFFGVSGDGKTAVIEMASASGLALLKPGERNPMVTTTYGTGELIRHVLDQGCNEIILGIGGSATVDGGVGMAQALGVSFTDDTGWEITPGGGGLGGVFKIDVANLDPRVRNCKIYAACDVSNPLTGPYGAAHIFGPQKGASPEMVMQLEDNLKHLARVIRDNDRIEVEKIPGGGAAGGMGAGIVAFLGGELRPGFELISRFVKLDDGIKWADLVITGEGKMDHQTAFGKTPAGVAQAASRLNKPVVAFTGSLGEEFEKLYDLGFAAIIPIADKPMSLQQSMTDAGRLLEHAAERTFRLARLGKHLPFNLFPNRI